MKCIHLKLVNVMLPQIYLTDSFGDLNGLIRVCSIPINCHAKIGASVHSTAAEGSLDKAKQQCEGVHVIDALELSLYVL